MITHALGHIVILGNSGHARSVEDSAESAGFAVTKVLDLLHGQILRPAIRR
jgi:hypothetical protein